MKQLTFQFAGYAPESFLEWKESESNANQLASSTIVLRLRAIVERASMRATRLAIGGLSLMGGMVLASGADTIPQALLTLAAFAVAGACLHEEGEKGGEV